MSEPVPRDPRNETKFNFNEIAKRQRIISGTWGALIGVAAMGALLGRVISVLACLLYWLSRVLP